MNKVKLPQPRILKNKKKFGYSLSNSNKNRQSALNKDIKSQKRKPKDSALSKIRRFGLIRILQRKKNPKYCKILTKDMKYLNNKYRNGKGKIKDIC